MNFEPTIEVVLVTPEIPQNAGNVIRLCANVGARLHLIEPLGFRLENTKLRRASLDYSDLTNVLTHSSIDQFFDEASSQSVYGATIPGTVLYTTPSFKAGDIIVFGPESVGLSDEIIDRINPENRIGIPMMPGNRSVNLSNAVAIILYEMWRQIGFYKLDSYRSTVKPVKPVKPYFS